MYARHLLSPFSELNSQGVFTYNFAALPNCNSSPAAAWTELRPRTLPVDCYAATRSFQNLSVRDPAAYYLTNLCQAESEAKEHLTKASLTVSSSTNFGTNSHSAKQESKHPAPQHRINPIEFSSNYPITFATYCLVRKLEKQGKIKKSEVAEILQRCCERLPSRNLISSIDNAHCLDSKTRTAAAAVAAHCRLQPGVSSLCGGVAARLASLRDRIKTSGSAILQPSTAIMGAPFIPALDFLRTLVLDVAKTAEVEPEAGPRKRRRTLVDEESTQVEQI